MKSIRNITKILLFSLIMAIGITSCGKDESEAVPKTINDYYLLLSDLVSSEIDKVETTVVGYNKGDFKATNEVNYESISNEYMDSLLFADSVLAIPGVTMEELVNANVVISVPSETFTDNLWISDRRPLHNVIVESDTLRVNTPVGDSIGEASTEAHSRFNTAITVAKSWRSSSTTIDRQVAAQTDSLQIELDVFRSAIN